MDAFTSSLLCRSWLISEVVLLSWVSKSNILDWVERSLAEARSLVSDIWRKIQHTELNFCVTVDEKQYILIYS